MAGADPTWSRRALGAAVITAILPAACNARAPARSLDPVRTQSGLTAYLGIMPAAVVTGHDPGTAGEMHPNAGRSPLTHHLVIALFDRVSGARIVDAQVTAIVYDRHGAATSHALERMTVAGALTYGNFISLPGGSSVTPIDVEVRRAGRQPVRFEFAYSHPN